MRVNTKDLQRETGLSEEALQYVKDICGPRYDAKKDEIKIVCTRSRNREHNRQWCLKVLYDLIMEGNREFPGRVIASPRRAGRARDRREAVSRSGRKRGGHERRSMDRARRE